jgi:hypothetical protein
MEKIMLLRKLFLVSVLLLSGIFTQAQFLVSNTTDWWVFNGTTPPADWRTTCDFRANWIHPVVSTHIYSPSQTDFVTNDIGGGALPIWIDNSNTAHRTLFFKAVFDLDQPCLIDSIHFAADDQCTVWINGHLLGSTLSWNDMGSYLIPAEFLQCGCNVIAVQASDVGSYYWWMACNLFQNPGATYDACTPEISITGSCTNLCFNLEGMCLCQEYAGMNVFGPGATDLGHGCYDFLPGNYIVELYYNDNCAQQTKIVRQEITVVDSCDTMPCMAHADYFVTGANPFIFTDLSSGSGPVTAWFWDFGDGTTSNLQNPVHTYAIGGLYNVCLSVIVQDDDGTTCCDYYCHPIRAIDPVDTCINNPDFTFSSSTLNPWSFNFTNTSTGYQIPCQVTWDFGDPASGAANNSTMLNAFHVFSSVGTFHVCLYMKYCVYDNNGKEIDKCENRICKDITAGPPYRIRRPTEQVSKEYLKQNIPNPFKEYTEINYTLPENSHSALFIVSDEFGKILMKKEISSSNGTIHIDASQFAPGTYNYQLVIEGVSVEGKRMVIMK